MELVTPNIGLVFWTTLAFLLLLFVLSKYAWTPILTAVKERESNIVNALNEAEKARAEMSKMTSDNEKLLAQTKEERSQILKEAKAIGEKLIEEAREKAKLEANKYLAEAKAEINNQKMAAITEVKNQVGTMAIELSEKILRKELSAKDAQQKYATELLSEAKLN
jgi:F-type H+-transporting ATPase subunit b